MIDNPDAKELLNEHQAEITTEELLHIQDEQKKTLEAEMSSEENERRKDVSILIMKEMCAKLN